MRPENAILKYVASLSLMSDLKLHEHDTDNSRKSYRPRAYSIVQAARVLSISPASVRRLIARGLLRPNRTLRHLRISESEIDRFLAQS